jgi:NAD(P)-dependent dehydrogenase (short-subunit alcohol dehydrogenase family)
MANENMVTSADGVAAIRQRNTMKYAARNVRVNSIHPSLVRPPALAVAMRERGDLPQALSDIAELQMLGGSGSATDVAAAILYLVSDASRFVSGNELVIDAGYGRHQPANSEQCLKC